MSASLARLDRLDPVPLLAAGGLVALVATAGSLYVSEAMGLVPCELCWYQRVLMYPLVVVFGVALVERRPGVSRTVLPLSTLGAWRRITPGCRSRRAVAVRSAAARRSSCAWSG